VEVFRSKGKLYLVFEYVEKTILEVMEQKPGGIDKEEIRKIMYQLLRGLDFIHSQNVRSNEQKKEKTTTMMMILTLANRSFIAISNPRTCSSPRTEC